MDSKFLNRQLICWLSYNPYFEDGGTENRVCYIYPRYILNNGHFEWIDSKLEFPTVGRIAVRIYGSDTASDIYNRMGPLVSVRINTDPQPAYDAKNQYTVRYNPSMGRDRSEIWITPIDSTSFYEIKESSQDINSILRYHECEPNYGESESFSNSILLRIGNMLYGPFDYTMRSGVMKLRGLERFDFMIGGYPIAKFDQSIITIRDQKDRDTVYALPTNLLTDPQACPKHYDMIDQHHLVDMFLDRVRAKMELSRTDMRALNQFCDEVFKGRQQLGFSAQRLETIKALLPQLFNDDDLYLKLIELTIDNDEFRQHLITDIVTTDTKQWLRTIPNVYVDEVKASLLSKTQESLLESPEVTRALNKQQEQAQKQAAAAAAAAAAERAANYDFLQDSNAIANINSLVREGNHLLTKLNAVYSSLAFAADPDIDLDMAANTATLNPTLIAHYMDVGGLIVKLCSNLRVVMHAALAHDALEGDKKQELQSLSDSLDGLYQNLNRRISELQSSKILADYTKNYQGVTDFDVKLEEITSLAGMGAEATKESLAAAQKAAENKIATAKAEAQRKIQEAQEKAEQQARLEAAAAEAGIAMAAAKAAKRKVSMIKNNEIASPDLAELASQTQALSTLKQELETMRTQLAEAQEQNKMLQSHNKQLSEELALYDEGYAAQVTASKTKLNKSSAKAKNLAKNHHNVVPASYEQTSKAVEALDAAISAKQQESKELNLKITEQNSEINAQQKTLAQLQAQNQQLSAQNEQHKKLSAELESKLKHAIKEYQDGASMAIKLLDAQVLGAVMGGTNITLSAPVAVSAAGSAIGSATTPVSAAPALTTKGKGALRSSEVSSDETMAKLAPNFDTSLLAPVQSVNSAAKILERVGRYLNEVGHRNLSSNDVANYLICITQGFITTFAGEPGTGKTSLCNLLARALGLSRGDGAERFCEVSVERGWTSLKDMIGYYNPLTKRMEKSNAEIFDAFVDLNREAQWASDGSAYNPAKIAPYFILLDEANLSPIEHYWAAFFRNCDFSPLSQRTISLGGNANWLLPDHLRFLATVNFDHTTEELSPRFLDRSWVITLEPNVVEMEQDVMPEHDETMVPFESLLQAFTPKEHDKLDEALADKWDAIQGIFAHEQCALPLRPRNIRMVYNYCLVAARCMTRATTSTKYAPLDYAVAQKILPTINGSGERYRYLITELQKECSEQTMPLCAQHLKRIERTGGADLGFYQFFAR